MQSPMRTVPIPRLDIGEHVEIIKDLDNNPPKFVGVTGHVIRYTTVAGRARAVVETVDTQAAGGFRKIMCRLEEIAPVAKIKKKRNQTQVSPAQSPAQQPVKQKCSCDMTQLMRDGCKCGGA